LTDRSETPTSAIKRAQDLRRPEAAIPLHVILVGAGIGGLTAALALSDRGVAVTLLEQTDAIQAVGAGIQLSANATRLLFRLGLEAPLRAVACAPEAVEVRDQSTAALNLRTRLGGFGEARWGAPYLQVHRADLQRLLLDAMTSRRAIDLRLGAKVDAVDQDSARAHVRLAGGEVIGGDAVIGCDGIHSKVRAALWGDVKARFVGQAAWRGLAPADPSSLAARSPLAGVWTAADRHFVHYPVRGGALINVVGVVEQRRWRTESWTAEADRSLFAKAFQGWPAPVPDLIAAVQTPWLFAIHDRTPLARWSRDRISLLGDAAHPAPPFLAQGAAMAIEDGEALARHIASAADVATAFIAYEDERKPRTAKVQAWSRRNARLFHLPSLAARGLFGAAAQVDRLTGAAPEARLDWLYGYRPPKFDR
jgi:salicylate hydroxylase